jgi:hypothetical protein
LLLLLLASILIPTKREDARNYVSNANVATTVTPVRATYLATRDAVLDRGVDVLPASTGSAKPVSLHGM